MVFISLFLVSCGGASNEKPEDIAKKAVESLLLGDPNKEEDVKVIKDILKENYKAEDIVNYFKKQSLVKIVEEEFIPVFKELKIEDQGKEFFDAYIGRIKISIGESRVTDSDASVEVIIEIPDVYNLESIDKIMEKEVEKKKDEVKNLKKEEIEKLILDITKSSMSKFIESVKATDKFEKQEVEIKLKKQKGAWHIIEI